MVAIEKDLLYTFAYPFVLHVVFAFLLLASFKIFTLHYGLGADLVFMLLCLLKLLLELLVVGLEIIEVTYCPATRQEIYSFLHVEQVSKRVPNQACQEDLEHERQNHVALIDEHAVRLCCLSSKKFFLIIKKFESERFIECNLVLKHAKLSCLSNHGLGLANLPDDSGEQQESH